MLGMAKKKARVGRPPKAASEKVVRLFIYVEPDVALRLDELARTEGDDDATAFAKRVLTKIARGQS